MTLHQSRVLALKLQGLTNPQIAERLASTPASIKATLTKLRKMGHVLPYSPRGFQQGIGRYYGGRRRREPA